MGLWRSMTRMLRSPTRVSFEDRSALRPIRARYDAAQTTLENQKQWAMADDYSADAAMITGVRRTLRRRARYEIANNSYARGIVLTVANDTIGRGPRLQIHGVESMPADASAPSIDEQNEVEKRWCEWSDSVGLGQKLRTMVMARIGDGESFGLMLSDPRNPHPVKLNIRLVESDQVADIWQPMLLPDRVDGVIFDEFHNPIEYHILKFHPGGLYQIAVMESDPWPARFVLHLFRRDRPDQARGVPEITPALELFAQLRRYTLAVLAAAETAADWAAVIQSNQALDPDSPAPEPYDLVELERRMATVLPDGYSLGQMKAEQPTTTYQMFKREILNEISRCLNIPYNVAACNSSSYNYASGRLDHQVYYKSLSVDRHLVETTILDKLFCEWFAEASRVYGWTFSLPAHCWRWDRPADIDPKTEADARLTRMSAGASPAREYAEAGLDWNDERQSAAEALGVTVEEYLTLLRQKLFANAAYANLPAEEQSSSQTAGQTNGE